MNFSLRCGWPRPSAGHAPSASHVVNRLHYVCDVCVTLMIVSVDFGLLSKPLSQLYDLLFTLLGDSLQSISVRSPHRLYCFLAPAKSLSSNAQVVQKYPKRKKIFVTSECFCLFCFLLLHSNFIAGWRSGLFVSFSLSVSLSEEKQFCNDHHICHVAIVRRINAFAAIFLMVYGFTVFLPLFRWGSRGNPAL